MGLGFVTGLVQIEQQFEMQNEVTLFLAGDVMTGRGIDQVLPHSVDPLLYEPSVKNARRYVRLAESHSGPLPKKIIYDYIWGDALDVLEKINPNVRIVNLETAVTTNSRAWPKKRIHYRMHPGNITILKEAEINLCILGNNHVLDWGRDGLIETISVLRNNDIMTAGAGLNAETALKPAVLDTVTGRLLVFSYGLRTAGVPESWQANTGFPGVNQLNNTDLKSAQKVINDIEQFREGGDRIVMSLHWGGNWGYSIPSGQVDFAYKLIDAGAADIIYGHSSHHPKGIEVYGDRLILYGCGDLINDYEGIRGREQYRDDLSLLYFPTLRKDGKLAGLKMVPMKIQKFRLNQPEEDDIDWITERLDRECRKRRTSIVRRNGHLELRW